MVRFRWSRSSEEYRELGWQAVTGASGTIKAIQEVIMTREGWSREGITLEALRRCVPRCWNCGQYRGLGRALAVGAGPRPGVSGRIRGAAWLVRSVGREPMEVSDGALREGVIYDLLGRIRHEDVRDRTIADGHQIVTVWIERRPSGST
jgi:exopolyphosphatase/guanosine-5'-triphosphate,3'-diphosphate pyrophosphatase